MGPAKTTRTNDALNARLGLKVAAGLSIIALGLTTPIIGNSVGNKLTPAKATGCLIEPEQVADVGTPVTGVIESLPVNLGDQVKVGQALAVLRSDVEKANAQAASLRSSVDAEARAAAANLALARQKAERAQQLVAQHFVSPQALEQALTEVDVAQQKQRLAVAQQDIYRQEQAVARAQVGLRTLRSPINGIVVERYSNLGERVEDRPVLRIASIHPLRVTLMMPMSQYGQLKEGDQLNILPDLPGLGPVQARVQHVDKVVDAASNTFRVRLQLPNEDHRLPGGLRCKADLGSKVSTTQVDSKWVLPTAVRSFKQSPDSLTLKATLHLSLRPPLETTPIQHPRSRITHAKPRGNNTLVAWHEVNPRP